ncbi:putative PrsW family intramembrane metalloprotease [Paenibacillus sp. 598K]|uniref:PrsW family glutamic-type intramembrane protease n=1 Tax=Paenibacillus sp. 598K TaxID=1117987 RepID=UPI000FF944D1|nr:PrsW family glutamic-type intramembrane protease [Paenibacillus sp. 598K]GBF74880.1 putative PrsW family intramembrane metalloprotease [Paenibacillus sp. 598K]
MYCPSCGYEVERDARFCGGCGSKLMPAEAAAASETVDSRPRSENGAGGDSSRSPSSGGMLQDFADRLHRVAGFEERVEIKLKDIFSDTFKRHSETDAERLFIVGTSTTTPTMDQLIETWPKPWLFMRIFIVAMIGFLGFYLGFMFFENANLLPGLIMVGSFVVPISLLIFFWEINAPQNIPLYRVMYYVFIGGMLSLVIALLFFETVGRLGIHAIIVGVIEETAKVLAVLWCLRKRPQEHYILNGLLVGAAVGTGFAAFESAGYALRMGAGSFNEMFTTIFWRGLLAPGGHIVWAALSGAAICMVKGRKPWSWSMLQDPRFLRIFIIVVGLHAAWNSSFSATLFPLSYLLLTAISWIFAFAMIHAGLQQVSQLKQQYIKDREQALADGLGASAASGDMRQVDYEPERSDGVG